MKHIVQICQTIHMQIVCLLAPLTLREGRDVLKSAMGQSVKLKIVPCGVQLRNISLTKTFKNTVDRCGGIQQYAHSDKALCCPVVGKGLLLPVGLDQTHRSKSPGYV